MNKLLTIVFLALVSVGYYSLDRPERDAGKQFE
jgi:hypothetical protein